MIGLFYEGDNILYNNDGKSYFELKENSLLIEKEPEKIDEWISQETITPTYYLKTTYVDFDRPILSLLVPYYYSKILRLSRG